MRFTSKKTILWAAGVIFVVGGLLVFGLPAPRHTVVGWMSGEPLLRGRPLSLLLHYLENGDASARRWAASELRRGTTYQGENDGNIPPFGGHAAQVISRLSHVLTEDPDSEVRASAAQALNWIASDLHGEARQAVPALSRALRRGDANVSEDCAKALGNIGRDAASAVPHLVHYFMESKKADNGSDAKLAELAIEQIGPAAVPELITFLETADARQEFGMRGHTARAWTFVLLRTVMEDDLIGLKKSNVTEEMIPAVPILAKALQDENHVVRVEAARALAAIGPAAEEATEELMGVFRLRIESDFPFKRTDVYTYAGIALGEIGSSVAGYVDELKELAKDESHPGRFALWRAIGKITRTVDPKMLWEPGSVGGHIVSAVAMNADATLFAYTHGSDGAVHIIDAKTGDLKRELLGHSKVAVDLAFSPDGKTLASGALDGIVRLWEVASGEQLANFDIDRRTSALAFHPEGKLLAVCDANPHIQLWNIDSRTVKATLNGFDTNIRSIAFIPDGTVLAAGEGGRLNKDSTVTLWDVRTEQLIHTLEPRGGGVTSLAFSSDGKQVAAGTADGEVHVWEAESGRNEASVAIPSKVPVYGVQFYSDDKMLLIVHEEEIPHRITGGWLLWNLATKKTEFRYRLGWRPRCMALSSDDKYLAIGGSDLSVWRLVGDER